MSPSPWAHRLVLSIIQATSPVSDRSSPTLHVNLPTIPTERSESSPVTRCPGNRPHVVTPARKPTARQRRRIQIRDRTCVFPGCRMPARGCDIDHTKAVQDRGETCDCNLAPLCRHDHSIKHQHGWTYQRRPDGTPQWTTQLGHTYTTMSESGYQKPDT